MTSAAGVPARAAVAGELSGRSREAVLAELAGAAAAAVPGLSAPDVLASVLEREKLGSTGIGDGAAIPHGKVKGLDDVLVVFGRSAEGVDFQSLDGRPARLFFMVLAPEGRTVDHLRALARISRLLKDPLFRESLLAPPDPGAPAAALARAFGTG